MQGNCHSVTNNCPAGSPPYMVPLHTASEVAVNTSAKPGCIDINSCTGGDEYVIFVTKGLYGLRTMSQFDAACASEASAGGHSGTFRAVMSGGASNSYGVTNARDRFSNVGEVKLPDGTLVADNGDHLFGAPAMPLYTTIGQDADGVAIEFMWNYVWTFSTSSGSYVGFDCGGGLVADNQTAHGGHRKTTDGRWLNDGTASGSVPCQGTNHRIYCMGRKIPGMGTTQPVEPPSSEF